jgi:hypothetical protein
MGKRLVRLVNGRIERDYKNDDNAQTFNPF